MSWTTVFWSMDAAACLTLAAIHLVVGLRRRAAANLLFSLMAVSAAVMAALELRLMHSPVPEVHAGIVRWAHGVFFVLFLSLVFFVRSYFRAGRTWLMWTVVLVRGASLALNFLVDPNLNYVRITGVRPLRFLGETIYLTEGVVSGRTRIAQLSSMLLLIYLLDAARTVWRRGDRRRAVLIGSSTALFVAVAAVHTALVMEGVVRSPYLISVAYLGVVAAMAYELTFDVIRSSELAQRLEAAGAELRESEQRMALAAEAANAGFWLYDVDKDEIWMSERGRATRGFPADAPIDFARFIESVHPEDRGMLLAGVDDAIRSRSDLEQEYRVVRPDGEVRWIASRGRLEAESRGGRRLRGISIDVTPRMLAQLEVERQRSELTHLSRVTMLGELSGSLAHELNQPLTAILANAQAAERFLSQDGADLDEVRAILADIVEEDKRAGEVIRRLRVLLKKGEVERQPLPLSEVVRDALELMRSDLVNRGVTLTAELPPDLPPAVGDRVQIQQVVLNLVANACDAMEILEPRDRRLDVRAETTEKGCLRVSVADCGPGLPAGVVERVFDPFFTTKTHGMGLGLAVCRTIVAAHGGELGAAGNTGGGATFHFTLPAAGGGLA
jgi:two-component system sensor kinase FixL